jgi:hypothetical protein
VGGLNRKEWTYFEHIRAALRHNKCAVAAHGVAGDAKAAVRGEVGADEGGELVRDVGEHPPIG